LGRLVLTVKQLVEVNRDQIGNLNHEFVGVEAQLAQNFVSKSNLF